MVHFIIDECGRLNNKKNSIEVKHDNEKERRSIGLEINYLYYQKNEKKIVNYTATN